MTHAVEACVHCGFCLAACPTYRELGQEMDTPRGRIVLMKQVLEGISRGTRPSRTSTGASVAWPANRRARAACPYRDLHQPVSRAGPGALPPHNGREAPPFSRPADDPVSIALPHGQPTRAASPAIRALASSRRSTDARTCASRFAAPPIVAWCHFVCRAAPGAGGAPPQLRAAGACPGYQQRHHCRSHAQWRGGSRA